jgi:plastocyanin
MRRLVLGGLAAALTLALAPSAMAAKSPIQYHTYKAGPYLVRPGANLILIDKKELPKPKVPGYVTSIAPNLKYAKAGGKCCGAIPRVDVIHLHHGVWLSNGKAGSGTGNAYGGLYPFFAAGEEKTTFQQPRGYGYPVEPSDHWLLNYMIHDLTPQARKVFVTYRVGFVPAASRAGRHMTASHPIWMDVQSGSLYPVFDVKRHSGKNGKFIYPLEANDPYHGGRIKNEWTAPTNGVLLGTGGHVHPGGLWDQLDITRPGVKPHYRKSGPRHGLTPGSVRLYRSRAHYWDPRGPISWDMAMKVTNADWRAKIKAGDKLSINAAYETKRASWYESMGIMVTYWVPGGKGGTDPFKHSLDQTGHLTHGHLNENRHHGGTLTALSASAPRKWPQCSTTGVAIKQFQYKPGDLTSRGKSRCAPTVPQGQSITFTNDDASTLSPGNILANPSQDYLDSIFHTVTSCQAPCGRDTGISYPLANGRGNYDSTQLGVGTPASGSISWSTPKNLKPGSYTYFCRIHPFMRGTFRVVRK